ncbi:Coiled-coil domain-containing protein 171 [Channa argus]|uniref:Coiled-coil domain-containing protein 171 n=1 Tax=Channa argus TaxID=215402 RepID=A0A6G1Q6J8_CHAAH|nr:Coiled-coil domain-containing protein 171 [Channa argus]
MQHKEKQAGHVEGRVEKEQEEDEEIGKERRRCTSRGDGGRRRERERDGAGMRAASEGRDRSKDSESLRWRINQLEKEKLELTSSHNQELCRLQAELTHLRSSVERGEAQRLELQYQLTVSQRHADQATELSRDKQALTAELQQKVQELKKALDITQRSREDDKHALRQDIEERDKFIQSFSSENQRLHQLLQDHEEALSESERRIAEVQKEREKEAKVNRRQAEEMKYLKEREERSRREKELRVRDLEEAVVAGRSGQQEAQSDLELLRAKFGEVERAYGVEREKRRSTEHTLERLQSEYEQYKSHQNVAMDTARKTTSDLTEQLEEEKRQHSNTRSLLEQVQDLLFALEKLREENQTLQQLTSDQSREMEESQQVLVKLKEEVTRLRQECSEWSTQSRDLQAELQREREEGERVKGREKEEKMAEIQKIKHQHQKESKAHLSFLYSLYQRLLAGCVLLDQPQSILGDFTWEELCDVINEQVDQLTSDLQKANEKIANLQTACEKKSVCVRELHRSQECVLSRLEVSVRKREEAWSRQHTHAVTQLQNELQVCHSQCESLREHVSSLDLQCSSLTSDLSRLQGRLSRSRRESASFFLACALLAGALKHAHCRLQTLSEQKTLLSKQLALRRALEEEVRKLADALGGDKKDEKEERGRRAVRRWRRGVCVVLAVRRWCALAKTTAVLFRLERSGSGPAVCVCGELATATQEGQLLLCTDKDRGREDECSRWLRSKRLSFTILSSMADLQGALAHADVMSAARSGLSRLLDYLLDQSDAVSYRVYEGTLSSRLRLGLNRVMPQQPEMKEHFLLFSQRLHSAEVERRSLRLEVASLKKGQRQERDDTYGTALSEARQELRRKERSLRILGKHLSGVQKERKQLEERLQRAEDELRDATGRKDCLISYMKAAETSYKEVNTHAHAHQHTENISKHLIRDSFLQSERPLSAQRRPLLLPSQHLELSGAEGIMGGPEVAACQSLLSTVSQLFHTCSARIDWLEQEVSANRSHVTALRSELQDACLRDNLAFVPVEFAKASLVLDEEPSQSAPSSDLSKEPIKTEIVRPAGSDRSKTGGGEMNSPCNPKIKGELQHPAAQQDHSNMKRS